MKRKQRFYALCLALLLGTHTVEAQTVTVSPLPQQIEWGEKAFDRLTPIRLVGTDRMDADVLEALKASRLVIREEAGVKLCVGQVGDKAVAKYKKLVPTQAEGYYLKVTPQEIVVAGRDASGTFYGVQTLLQLFTQPQVMQCEVTDWPSVSCRGVIEGFYGNPWSHEDRLRQFDFYGRNKMNVYVYGPKDDPYHRAHWRDPYPEQEAARLHELVEAAHKNKVQFVWAIHPGGDIQWNKADSMAVVDKLEKMYTLGIRTFAVFFDDIWGEGAKGDKQAGLLNYVT
ncbi:MAG: beta-N-acetylglucosaminidase domain-containing protein, partial [Bacteroidaceae bacterium]